MAADLDDKDVLADLDREASEYIKASFPLPNCFPLQLH
jgi:hypothetical protein